MRRSLLALPRARTPVTAKQCRQYETAKQSKRVETHLDGQLQGEAAAAGGAARAHARDRRVQQLLRGAHHRHANARHLQPHLRHCKSISLKGCNKSGLTLHSTAARGWSPTTDTLMPATSSRTC